MSSSIAERQNFRCRRYHTTEQSRSPRKNRSCCLGGRLLFLWNGLSHSPLKWPQMVQTGRSAEKASPPIAKPRNSKRKANKAKSKSRPLQRRERRDWSGRFLFGLFVFGRRCYFDAVFSPKLDSNPILLNAGQGRQSKALSINPGAFPLR